MRERQSADWRTRPPPNLDYMHDYRKSGAIELTGFFGVLLVSLLTVACASPPPAGSDPTQPLADAGPLRIDAGPAINACESASGEAAQPFGAHGFQYAAGTIKPSAPQDELDDATANYYFQWKARYLRTGSPCPSAHTFVRTDHEESRMTVSEAHGYGMIILAFMAGRDPEAHRLFDEAYAYFRAHPSSSSSYRMAWSQNNSCQDSNGPTSATDGDLDIAYALLLADKQWGSGGAIAYRAEADKVIAAIAEGDVDASNSYLLLGDWVGTDGQHYRGTRSSDFMPGHLASFAAATGDVRWTELSDRLYSIIEQTSSSQTGLIPDFIAEARTNPQPAPPDFLENPSDGAYSYNACRDPWRLAVHYLVHGDSRAKALLDTLNGWIRSSTGGDPARILPGYNLDGSSLGRDYRANAFNGPFAVGAMVDADNQAWLDELWNLINETDHNEYYDDSLKLLSMIALSGNWWAPEKVPCPE
jgi:endo-1,4-beta-D-glucanase Y